MRQFISVITIAAVFAAGLPISPVSAQTAPVVSVRAVPAKTIASIFHAHPNGGPEMAAQIADLIVRQPNLTADLVNHVKNIRVNEQQKRAVEQGLAEALTRLKAANQFEDEGYDWVVIGAVIAVLAILGAAWFFLKGKKDAAPSPS
jgi:hypothetical protein